MTVDSSLITIILSILSTLGIGSVLSAILVDRYKDRKEKRKEQEKSTQEERKRDRQAEFKEVIDNSLSEKLGPIEIRLSRVEEQQKTLAETMELNNEGTLNSLRMHLLNTYYSCAKKGFRTRYESESFRKMYSTYTKMHGNTFIQDDIFHGFEEIPSKENSKYAIKEK